MYIIIVVMADQLLFGPFHQCFQIGVKIHTVPPITMLDTTPTQPGFLHVSFGSLSCLWQSLRFAPSPVSGFPLRASLSPYPMMPRCQMGLSSSCMHLFIHATA
jgi:hypothetical protein